MTAAWIALGLLVWLAVVALILACARKMRMPEQDAQEAVDSCRAALTECEPQTRRVRAGA